MYIYIYTCVCVCVCVCVQIWLKIRGSLCSINAKWKPMVRGN